MPLVLEGERRQVKILDREKEKDMFTGNTNRNVDLSKTAFCIVLGRVNKATNKAMKRQGNFMTIFERASIGLIPQDHSKPYITKTTKTWAFFCWILWWVSQNGPRNILEPVKCRKVPCTP